MRGVSKLVFFLCLSLLFSGCFIQNEAVLPEKLVNEDGSYIVYAYDENDIKLSETLYTAEGGLQMLSEFDAEGNLRRTMTYNPKNDRRVQEIVYSAEGIIEEISDFDMDGHLIRLTLYNPDGTVQFLYEWMSHA